MNLMGISFPVFKLKKLKPNEEGSITFYIYRDKVKVIDDKSLEGDTLAKRRLKIDEKELMPLKQGIFFLGDLIKIAEPNLYFIDSKGKFFTLKKSKRVPLVYKRISNVKRNIGSTIINVEGLMQDFYSLLPPLDIQKYAALLCIAPHCYILYGFSDIKHPNTYRKI